MARKYSLKEIVKNNRFVGTVYCDKFLVFRNSANEVLDVDNTKIELANGYILRKIQQTTINGNPVYLVKSAEIHRNNRKEIEFYVYSNFKIDNI